MFTGVMALLERSLRVDARAWGPHLARFGLMAAIYIAVCYATLLSARFGAPGLRFFGSIAYLNLAFMTLLGVSFFSTAITEEKEEDNLGLMLMAGISPLGILLGKSGGRIVQAVLLLAVQYPFTILAVTLGGVTQDQIWSTYLGMLSYMVMLAGVGLLCSTLSTRNRTASIRLILIVLAYWVVPLICTQILILTRGKLLYFSDVFSFIGGSCIFIQMRTILISDFHESMWSPQVVSNLSIGGLGFLLSRALFGLAMREPSTEATTRGMLTRTRGAFRLFSPGRSWELPMVWKDFHFVAGGIGAILVRVAFYGLLWFIAYFSVGLSLFGGFSNVMKQTTAMFLVLCMFAVAIDAAFVVSRSLNDEVRSQTLSTLMMLPMSSGRILYAKIVGSLLGWLPGPICLFFGMFVHRYGRESTWEFFRNGGAPCWLIAHLLLIPHASAVFAMFVRWGALPLGIGMAFGSLIFSVSMFEGFRVGQNSPIVWMVTFAVLGLCAICHIVVWLKAEALCSR